MYLIGTVVFQMLRNSVSGWVTPEKSHLNLPLPRFQSRDFAKRRKSFSPFSTTGMTTETTHRCVKNVSPHGLSRSRLHGAKYRAGWGAQLK